MRFFRHISKENLDEFIEDYPTFNVCDHYLVDMSNLGGNNWMDTISIKLPNGKFVTICVMQTSKKESCLDVQFHGDNKETKVLAFENGRTQSLRGNMYALVCNSK